MASVVFIVTSVNQIQTERCLYASVVGDIPQLGGWDTKKALKAVGPLAGEYMAKVNIPKGLQKFEFKWIFTYKDGRVLWENGTNKVITNLPKTTGYVCYITNQIHGQAKIEIVPPDNSVAERSAFAVWRESMIARWREGSFARWRDSTFARWRDSSFARWRDSTVLNPKKWSMRNKILGSGLGILIFISICAAVKKKRLTSSSN